MVFIPVIRRMKVGTRIRLGGYTMSYVTRIFTALLLVFAIGAVSAQGADRKEPIHVAVSVYSTGPVFMRKWLNDLNRHPAVLDGRVKLHVFDCAGSHAFQHMHFETISTLRYDAVIVVANDFYASQRLVGLLAGTGIPVVASCAQTNTDDLDAFIGPDDIRAGYLTAISVAEALDGHGNVVVLRGLSDQGATKHRTIGISEALREYPGVKEIRSTPGNWSRAEAMQVVQGLIDRGIRIDGIIAQNDEMALGALAILKANAKTAIPVASIDGLPDAVDAVQRGELLQTLRQDSALQAQGALDLTLRELIGREYAPESPAWPVELLEQWEADSQHRYIVRWEVITAPKMALSTNSPQGK